MPLTVRTLFSEIAEGLEERFVVEECVCAADSICSPHLRTLYRLAFELESLDSERLIEAAKDAFGECLDFDEMHILLREGDTFQTVASWEGNERIEPSEESISRPFVARSLATGLAQRAYKKPEASDGTDEASPSMLCVPLFGREGILGAIYLQQDGRRASFTEEALQAALLLGASLARNLSNLNTFRELRLGHAKLSCLFNSLEEGVLVTDESLRIVSANPAARTILGQVLLEEQSFPELLEQFECEAPLENLRALRRFQIETRPETQGETPKAYLVTRAETGPGGPEDWRYVFCLHDFGHARHLEHMKSFLVKRLAQDLMGPLTVLSNVNDLLASESAKTVDPELDKLLSESRESAQECNRLLRQFVDYSAVHFSSSLSFVHWDRYPLEQVIQEAAETHDDLTHAKNFNVTIAFERGRFTVGGDRNKLKLTFQHIIHNAIRFGRENGTLEISVVDGSDSLRVQFRDDGPGFSPQALEYVTLMLHQLELQSPWRLAEVHQAGLGLWVVHAIVHAHGGHVRLRHLETEAGQRTEVEIELPRSAAPRPVQR